MPIKARTMRPGHYEITGTWLDSTVPLGEKFEEWSDENLRLIGILVIARVDPTMVNQGEGDEQFLTLNDGELRLHFAHAIPDPKQPEPNADDPVYKLRIPHGLICNHKGDTHEVTRPAYVVVPRHVFGVPDDITPCIVDKEAKIA